MSEAPQSIPLAGIVQVALPVPMPQVFDYLSGDFALRAGCRVRVPFGRTHRVGIVVEIAAGSDMHSDRLKPIEAALDDEPLLDAELLANLHHAARWLRCVAGDVGRRHVVRQRTGYAAAGLARSGTTTGHGGIGRTHENFHPSAACARRRGPRTEQRTSRRAGNLAV